MKKAIAIFCIFLTRTVFSAEAEPLSARQTFHRLCRLLGQGRLQEARSLMLQADELASFACWKFGRQKYQERVDNFLREFSAELSNGVRLERAETADALILPASKKNSRQVLLVVIHAYFELPGKGQRPQAVPFFLVQYGGAWKLWLR